MVIVSNVSFPSLTGKNNRLWELINNLEKKNEDLGAEVDSLQHEINIYEQRITDYEQLNKTLKKIEDKSVVISNNKFIEQQQQGLSCHPTNGSIVKDVGVLEKEISSLKNAITELKVQVKVEHWQKEEIDSQLQDVVLENQLLHQKMAELNKEILDWESFAQKEECYRRIAEAFTIKHNIEVEETFVRTAHCNGGLSMSPGTISKARSCEFLNRAPAKEESLPTIIKGSELRKSLQSSLVQSNSLLSELDKEYDVLVKRYEALLEKCKQDGKYNENPERTRKVQRAIQTLSLDFSKLTTPIQSPMKPSKSLIIDEGCRSVASSSTPSMCNLEHGSDYRALFSQIFAKLKEAPPNPVANDTDGHHKE